MEPESPASPVDDALKAMLLVCLQLHGLSADLDGVDALLVHARRNLDAHLLLHAFEPSKGLEPAAVFRA